MYFWQRVILNAVVFIATAGFFPQYLHVSNIWISLIAAVVLGVLNMFVKPLLVIFSLPITIMSLGIFYFVINGFMLELTAKLVGTGFQFSSFGAAFFVALILSLVNLVITNHFSFHRL
ncbi:phage holin family protein [Liquorilactobacillus sicerae]|uniref:phage holin family protein n=1 Tax=Liquorilactobacillus sicerae TaxID=1416943 RepID=UPI00248125A2|nr:phage holin family protein [Liquorilactobacillus sicerae]